MKKNSCFLVIILLFTVTLSAQDGITSARWQPAEIVTDGNNSEWAKPLNLYDAESGLLFTVTNNSKTLYFCFTAKDGRKISKLMKAGWGIEISSKEKKKKFDALITFPAIQMINAPGKDPGIVQNEKPDFKNDIDLYKLNLQTVKTTGFVTANGDIPLLMNDKINIGVGADSSQEIIFEIAIPFKELFPGNDAELKEELTLGVTVNALKRPAYQGNTDGGGSFSGRGGGGGGGGRMGGGGGGRMGGGRRGGGGTRSSGDLADRSQLFSKVSFKQKFTLTAQ
ncbi:MAG TPA: hypothetical protein VK645_07510 [Chitinophagaceae bacterium]|nr:hypothetical protein [Chitinophagaceae bacterium]